MRRSQLLVVSALLLGCGNAHAERVARFQVNGHDSHKPGRPTAYVFLGDKCPTTQKYLVRLGALEKEVGDKVAFVFLYPNISALPLPATLVNAYQGILPTYLYAFQFGVNTVERGATVFQDLRFGILMAFLVVACGVVAWSARMWRLAAAEDAARERGGFGAAHLEAIASAGNRGSAVEQ